MTMNQETKGGLTKNQSLVFETLSSARAPLSAYTILDKLRDRGFRAPLQVYRALDKLMEGGAVHRLESLNAFVACNHPDCQMRKTIAFTICDTCGQVEEINDEVLSQHLETIAKRNEFQPQKLTVELRGLCMDCR